MRRSRVQSPPGLCGILFFVCFVNALAKHARGNGIPIAAEMQPAAVGPGAPTHRPGREMTWTVRASCIRPGTTASS